jgi:hypothetical protein
MDVPTTLKAYADTFSSWQAGYEFWRYVYYFLGASAVALPAFVAAGVPSSDVWKRVTSALAAAMVAIFTWLQPGARATAHEHAYVCLEMVLDGVKIGAYQSVGDLKKDADHCSRFIDYEYVDRQPDNKPAQTGTIEPAKN